MNRFISNAVNLVDKLTAIPGKISDFGDELNERMITAAGEFQTGATAAATKNLTAQKIKSVGRNTASFLHDNYKTVALSLAFIAGAAYFLKKR